MSQSDHPGNKVKVAFGEVLEASVMLNMCKQRFHLLIIRLTFLHIFSFLLFSFSVFPSSSSSSSFIFIYS